MENIFKILYTIGYETLWKPKAIGEAPPARHRIAKKEKKSAGSVPEDRMFCKFCFPLVGRISEEGSKSPKTETGAWEATEIEPASKADFDTDSSGRSDELRIFNRPLDSAPGDRSDRRPFWNFISSEPSVEILAGAGVELSEARETGTGTERSSNPTLEALQMAPYKKTPKGLVPIWYFLTKAGSSWFLMLSEHGRPLEKHLYCNVLTIGRRYRPFRLSVFLQNENVSLFMPGFIPIRTLNPPKLPSFSVTCSSTSVAMWYYSGTAVVHTKESWSENLSISIPVCIVTGSLDTLQNSTQMNSSGICLNVNCPTAFPETCGTLNNFCILHSRECSNLRNYCGLVFIYQIYHGVNYVSITYA